MTLPLGVERRALRIPTGALVAHVLQPHRFADGFRQHGGVSGAVVGIVAAVGAGTHRPDHVHFVERHAERKRKPLLHEVLDDAHDRIAGFAARRLIDLFENLLKPLDVFFRFAPLWQMRLDCERLLAQRSEAISRSFIVNYYD